MTAPEKGRWYWVRNWLHYHWVYLVIAAVVLWVGISWLANALHWGETLPDYQIAYVGKSALPEDTAHAIEAAFAQYGEDLNGDGIVSVKQPVCQRYRGRGKRLDLCTGGADAVSFRHER